MIASGTPWDESETVSFSGHCVMAIRCCRMSMACCGTSTRNGRIAGFSVCCVVPSSGVVKVVVTVVSFHDGVDSGRRNGSGGRPWLPLRHGRPPRLADGRDGPENEIGNCLRLGD